MHVHLCNAAKERVYPGAVVLGQPPPRSGALHAGGAAHTPDQQHDGLGRVHRHRGGAGCIGGAPSREDAHGACRSPTSARTCTPPTTTSCMDPPLEVRRRCAQSVEICRAGDAGVIGSVQNSHFKNPEADFWSVSVEETLLLVKHPWFVCCTALCTSMRAPRCNCWPRWTTWTRPTRRPCRRCGFLGARAARS